MINHGTRCIESPTPRGILTAGRKITVILDKAFGGDINPAVWNPPASAGEECGVTRGRSRYCREPPAPAGGAPLGEMSSLLMDFAVASTSGSTCLMKYPAVFSSPNYFLSFLTAFPIPTSQDFVMFSHALEADFIHLLIIGNPWKTFSMPSILSVLIPSSIASSRRCSTPVLFLIASLTIFVPISSS